MISSPKEQGERKDSNQMVSPQLMGLIAQVKEEKSMQNDSKQYIMLHHEDLSSQLIWALQCYVSVDVSHVAGGEEVAVAAAPAQQAGGGDDEKNPVVQIKDHKQLPTVET